MSLFSFDAALLFTAEAKPWQGDYVNWLKPFRPDNFDTSKRGREAITFNPDFLGRHKRSIDILRNSDTYYPSIYLTAGESEPFVVKDVSTPKYLGLLMPCLVKLDSGNLLPDFLTAEQESAST